MYLQFAPVLYQWIETKKQQKQQQKQDERDCVQWKTP